MQQYSFAAKKKNASYHADFLIIEYIVIQQQQQYHLVHAGHNK